jgi:hypothetical protein
VEMLLVLLYDHYSSINTNEHQVIGLLESLLIQKCLEMFEDPIWEIMFGIRIS